MGIVDLGGPQQIPMITVPDVAQTLMGVSTRQIAAMIFTEIVGQSDDLDPPLRDMAAVACRAAFVLVDEYEAAAKAYEDFRREEAEREAAVEKPRIVTPT